MKNLALLSLVVALLALTAASAFCETRIYLESTGDIFCVTTLRIPCADISIGLDSCGSDTNLVPSSPQGYLGVALTIVKATGKAALKLAAVLVQQVV